MKKLSFAAILAAMFVDLVAGFACRSVTTTATAQTTTAQTATKLIGPISIEAIDAEKDRLVAINAPYPLDPDYVIPGQIIRVWTPEGVRQYNVQPGDHYWMLAEARLRGTLFAAPQGQTVQAHLSTSHSTNDYFFSNRNLGLLASLLCLGFIFWRKREEEANLDGSRHVPMGGQIPTDNGVTLHDHVVETYPQLGRQGILEMAIGRVERVGMTPRSIITMVDTGTGPCERRIQSGERVVRVVTNSGTFYCLAACTNMIHSMNDVHSRNFTLPSTWRFLPEAEWDYTPIELDGDVVEPTAPEPTPTPAPRAEYTAPVISEATPVAMAYLPLFIAVPAFAGFMLIQQTFQNMGECFEQYFAPRQ